MRHREIVPSDQLSFLAGGSEMARMIRERDWSTHPFGPPGTWPQSLRSALSICLHSAFPTAIYWGPELRLLYNDAWAPIPGPRHPAALGAPAREVWADIWHVIEPQFSELLATGEGIFVENQMLPMRRYGALETTYWNYSFTAIRGEDGTIAGIFNSGNETTAHVLQQRQMRFLLELGEHLRSSQDPATARRTATGLLGAYLEVDRVVLAETADDAEGFAIVEVWTADQRADQGADQAASAGHVAALAAFGGHVLHELRAGRVVRIDNVATHPEAGDLRAKGVGAVVAVPWLDSEGLSGALLLHVREPRAWNEFDVTTVKELLERTGNWIQRIRAAERERIMVREVDHRARNVLAVAQSLVRLTSADDLEAYRDKVEARMGALAGAHALLASKKWKTVELSALLEQELAPFRGGAPDRVLTDGPRVALPPDLTQNVALLLHELATNAAKHGAFRTEQGRLAVTWEVDRAGNLRFAWSETVHGQLSRPPGAVEAGFGTRLLDRVVRNQLGGTLDQELTPSGLRCRIEIPLAKAGREAGGAKASRTRPPGAP
jgi:two-component sensor histidine kinase